MPEAEVPIEVVEFIARHISSVEHLEILILLSNAPDRDWTAAEVYKIIKSNQSSIEERLKELSAHGLLVLIPAPLPTYRLANLEPKTRGLVAELGNLYKQRRVRIIETIYPASDDRVLGLADAFKIRRNK